MMNFWTRHKSAMIKKLYQEEHGFSLLELLLVIGVFASIAIGVVEITDNWTQRQKVESAATHLGVVHSAAQAYVEDNFTNIEAAALGAGGNLTIPIDDDGIGQPFFLKEGGTYLPANFNPRNIYRQDLEVLINRVSATRLEAVVVSTNRAVDFAEMLSVAQTMGPNAGLAVGQTAGGYNQNDFSGVNNAWDVPLANFAGTGWSVANPLAIDEAHLAAYFEVDQNAAIDDYLYRVDIAGQPDANRMFTDLDMNNNTMNNAAEMSADFAGVTGNLTVQAANMDVSQGYVAEGDITADRLEVIGSLDVTSMVTNGNINVGNQLNITGDMTGNGFNIGSGNFTRVNSTALTNANVVNTDNVVSVNMNFNGAGSSVIMNSNTSLNANNLNNVTAVQAEALGAAVLQNINRLRPNGARLDVRNTVNVGSVNTNNGRVGDNSFSQGSFDEDSPNPVNLNVNINTLIGCATTTNGNC